MWRRCAALSSLPQHQGPRTAAASTARYYYGSSPLGDAVLTSLRYPPLSSPHQIHTHANSSAESHTLRPPHFCVFSPPPPPRLDSRGGDTDTARHEAAAAAGAAAAGAAGAGLPVRTAAGPHGEGCDSSCHFKTRLKGKQKTFTRFGSWRGTDGRARETREGGRRKLGSFQLLD